MADKILAWSLKRFPRGPFHLLSAGMSNCQPYEALRKKHLKCPMTTLPLRRCPAREYVHEMLGGALDWEDTADVNT